MMRAHAVAVGVVALALAAPAALAKPAVRQGVPVDSLTPVGMERVRVRAPAVSGQPVRLTFAAAGTTRAALLVEVVVGADAAEARAALAHWRHQLARDIAPLADLGDEAYGSTSVVAFARDNIMVVTRRVSGNADLAALAGHMLEAVAAAPRGAPTPARVDAAVPRTLVLGERYDVARPSDVLAADLEVGGPARARRTADGWRVQRTGEGDVSLRVIAVDTLLRVTP